ncbi:MAG: hypothetical protein U0231_18045 [Nitrospiraceae bacterium]
MRGLQAEARWWARNTLLRVRQGRSLTFDSIGFRMGSFEELGLTTSKPVDLAFSPERNHWNGYDCLHQQTEHCG